MSGALIILAWSRILINSAAGNQSSFKCVLRPCMAAILVLLYVLININNDLVDFVALPNKLKTLQSSRVSLNTLSKASGPANTQLM